MADIAELVVAIPGRGLCVFERLLGRICNAWPYRLQSPVGDYLYLNIRGQIERIAEIERL